MRSKLKLDLETLAVDSFDTANDTAKNGTVFGEQCTCWTNCTCPGCPSCDHTACGQASCDGTCDTCNTCQNTCQASCGLTCFESCQPRLCGSAAMSACDGMICH